MSSTEAIQQPAPGHAVPGRTPIRAGRFSGVWRPRSAIVVIAGLGALLVAMTVNIGLGEYPISPGEVLGVLFGGGERSQQFIVLDLRLPRSLTGALVGAALAASGALTQSIARNPLASPDMIGITSGASAVAVALIVLGGSIGSVGSLVQLVGLPLSALFGGLLTATAIYLLAWRGGIQGNRLVLVGIGINAMMLSAVSWLLILGDVTEAGRAVAWLTGSLNARSWEHVRPVGLALLVLLPVALLLTFVLGALQLGDDSARGLGVGVNRARTALLLVAVGLAAVATASAGPIGFVALVSPQIAMRLVGSSRPPVLAAAVLGALLVVVADLIARTAFGSIELPVGIVTAVLGAPYLMYLIARQHREVRL